MSPQILTLSYLSNHLLNIIFQFTHAGIKKISHKPNCKIVLVSQLYDLYLPLLFSGSLELYQINGIGFCNPFQAIVGDFLLLECSQNVEAYILSF